MITSFFAGKTNPIDNVNIAVNGDDDDDGYESDEYYLSPSTKGLIISTVFTLIYYIRPIHMGFPILMIIYGNLLMRLIAYLLIGIIILSFALPIKPMPDMVYQWLHPMLDYFQYDEIIENSPIHIQESVADGQQYIFACQPHGIVPFCSIGWSIRQSLAQKKVVPTAVANLVLHMPILKHMMGMFGCVTASQMKSELSQKQVPCVRLYVGSTTEIFYCSHDTETLHLSKRKKFIKLALMMGVDIIPVYMFGNTEIFSPIKSSILIRLSDFFQFPVTWIIGRYYLPIPRKQKLLYVSGQPLGLPHIKRPRSFHVDRWHKRYCEQVQRIFEQYKERHPKYKNKKLVIV